MLLKDISVGTVFCIIPTNLKLRTMFGVYKFATKRHYFIPDEEILTFEEDFEIIPDKEVRNILGLDKNQYKKLKFNAITGG